VHHELRDLIAREAKKIGLHARKEVYLNGLGDKHIDLCFNGLGPAGADLYIDTTIRHPHSSRVLDRAREVPAQKKFASYKTPGAAAAQAETEKAALYRNHIGASQLLTFAVESYGRLGKEANDVVAIFANKAAEFHSDGSRTGHDNAKAAFILTFLRKISTCVLRGQVRNMRYRQQEAAKALHNDPNVFHFDDAYEYVRAE
jgi:hypothetical protein